MKIAIVLVSIVVLSCGPSAKGGGETGGDDEYDGPVGSLSGRVWAPGNGPGMVPAGHEIPIAGAHVRLSLSRPPTIPQEAYCEQCLDDSNLVFTDAAGSFEVNGIRPQQYWLTIQKGQFRLEQQVEIIAETSLSLSTEQATLPSVHDPDQGKWIPRIALVPGAWDRLEDVIGKMGIGEVNTDGAFQGDSAPTQLELYSGDGGRYVPFPPQSPFDPPYQYKGTVADLFSDVEKLSQYHIIFIPCGGDTEYTGDADEYGLLQDPAVRDRIAEYVRRGGKLYITDWSSEWEDGVFPEFVAFDSVDTSSSSAISHGNGPNDYTSVAKAADPGLNAWLGMQTGPKPDQSTGTFDANDLDIRGNWNRISGTPEIVVGQDENGVEITEQAHTWVVGDWGNGEGPIHPLTVTFEPTGCGRVMYSTYHTTEGVHSGLVPQERVLLYLIMEIGECKDGPIFE